MEAPYGYDRDDQPLHSGKCNDGYPDECAVCNAPAVTIAEGDGLRNNSAGARRKSLNSKQLT